MAVYVNGNLARNGPAFPFDGALSGTLIVGDAPRQPDSFRGKIGGLAIYSAELSAADVSADYRRWAQYDGPDVSAIRPYLALYLFNEGAGRVIHNHAGPAGVLVIPEKYTVLDKIALEPFWTEFDLTEEYWRGNLKNVIGFVPVGFVFYAYFAIARRMRRPVLLTIMVGLLISFTIEGLQAFLPTRDSGTTDILTNTIGTWLGVLFFQMLPHQVHFFRETPQPSTLTLSGSAASDDNQRYPGGHG